MAAVRRLFPDLTAELDDEALAAAYAHPADAGPYVRLNFVASVDGAVTVDGRAGGLGTPGDKRVFDLLRGLCDVLLVGAGTVRAEGYGPLRDTPRRPPTRAGDRMIPPYAVVSGALDLDPGWAVFTESAARPIVITRAAAPADRRAALATVADVLVAGDDRVDLAAAVDQLARRGHPRVLCEGGPRLFGSLLAAGIVDELCLTVSPLLAGTGPGRIVAGEPLPERTRAATLRHVLEDDGSLLLRYAVGR
jgi:riboflavin biosynthesis pyrimidine reductase